MNEKKALKSKTIIANGLVALAAISTAFGLDLGLDAATQSSITVGAMAIVNIILRLMTSKAIKF